MILFQKLQNELIFPPKNTLQAENSFRSISKLNNNLES